MMVWLGYRHGFLFSLYSSLVLLGSFLFLLASVAQVMWALFGCFPRGVPAAVFFSWLLCRRVTR